MANVFNLGESFQRGYATGSQVVARREANKLAQQQAMIPPGGWIDASGLPNAIPPGAYTGDTNALAQVAAHDPGKAYKLKTQYEKDQREGTQDDLAIEKTRLEIAEIKRESEQAAAEAASKLSDAEKAAEERRIGGLVAGAREAYLDGPEAWEMFKQAYAGQIEASGMNPDALTYEMAPAAMAVAVGNLEGIKRAREFSSHFDPAEPEIKVIDGQIVQIGPDGASVMPVEGMPESADDRAAQLQSFAAEGVAAYQQGEQAYTAWRNANLSAITAMGKNPTDFDFANAPVALSGIVGGLDGVDASQDLFSGPEWRPATPEEAAQYGAAAGQINDATGKFQAAPKQQSRLVLGADGNPVFAEGDAAANFKFTEGQSKDNVYVTKARGALEVLDPVSDSLTGRGDSLLEGVPLGVGREFQSDNFQVAKTAGLEFLAAILRKDTGAAVTASEEDMYGRMYLPQMGDGEPVLEAKREARARAVKAIEAGMNPMQIYAVEKALRESSDPGPEAAPASPPDAGGDIPRLFIKDMGGPDFAPKAWADAPEETKRQYRLLEKYAE